MWISCPGYVFFSSAANLVSTTHISSSYIIQKTKSCAKIPLLFSYDFRKNASSFIWKQKQEHFLVHFTLFAFCCTLELRKGERGFHTHAASTNLISSTNCANYADTHIRKVIIIVLVLNLTLGCNNMRFRCSVFDVHAKEQMTLFAPFLCAAQDSIGRVEQSALPFGVCNCKRRPRRSRTALLCYCSFACH